MTALPDAQSFNEKWEGYVERYCDVTVEQAEAIVQRGEEMFNFASEFAKENPTATQEMFNVKFRQKFGSGKYEVVNTEACVDYYLKWQMIHQVKNFSIVVLLLLSYLIILMNLIIIYINHNQLHFLLLFHLTLLFLLFH